MCPQPADKGRPGAAGEGRGTLVAGAGLKELRQARISADPRDTCGKTQCRQVVALPSFISLHSWKTQVLKTALSWLSKPYLLYSKEKVNRFFFTSHLFSIQSSPGEETFSSKARRF